MRDAEDCFTRSPVGRSVAAAETATGGMRAGRAATRRAAHGSAKVAAPPSIEAATAVGTLMRAEAASLAHKRQSRVAIPRGAAGRASAAPIVMRLTAAAAMMADILIMFPFHGARPKTALGRLIRRIHTPWKNTQGSETLLPRLHGRYAALRWSEALRPLSPSALPITCVMASRRARPVTPPTVRYVSQTKTSIRPEQAYFTSIKMTQS